MASSMHAESGEREKWIKHYSNHHKILLVGEGDFSFAACLARASGSAPNIVATSLDSEMSLGIKHPTAAASLVELKDKGSTIIHEVDVCNMSEHPRLKHMLFDRIVFNFPHAGFGLNEGNKNQIQLHQDVVRNFLNNARNMLRVDGEVHITHKTAYPFSAWNIEELGKNAGMPLIEESCFWMSDYPGYVNRRGGDGNHRSTTLFQ